MLESSKPEQDVVMVLAKSRLFYFLAIAIISTAGFSATAVAQSIERGVEFSVFGSSFFGGESGPTVVNAPIHPETSYSDTFGTGFGISAQYFRQIRSVFRWQAGLIYQNWPGEYFEGGEFQPGWEFGAAGQFGDLEITGIYGGFTVIRQPGAKLRPFVSMDLAIVNMSKLNVVVSGVSEPYWDSSTKDYMIVKGGLAYQVSEKAAVTFHAGFSVMGEPESVSVFTGGTSGSSTVLGIGASYTF